VKGPHGRKKQKSGVGREMHSLPRESISPLSIQTAQNREKRSWYNESGINSGKLNGIKTQGGDPRAQKKKGIICLGKRKSSGTRPWRRRPIQKGGGGGVGMKG